MKRIYFLLSAMLLSACAQEELPERLLGQVDCQTGQCLLQAQQMAVALHLPDHIKPLQPFTVSIALDTNLAVDAVKVNFVMPGMDMGENRYVFSRGAEGDWTGQPMLPICVTGRSDWRAKLEVEAEGVVYQAWFDFVIGD